ncbi:hypothetical protein FPQ18DRAFT_307827 [Pyronema domesticum]|nr:hypothetical protein FPQ18DRAFT_307827 [Pyronema domesticum]
MSRDVPIPHRRVHRLLVESNNSSTAPDRDTSTRSFLHLQPTIISLRKSISRQDVRVRVPGGVPHDNDSTRQRPGFIDDNYSKEIPLIGAEYNLPRDGDLQENSFFNNHGMAGINPDLYGMGLQVGSWDKFLFEQLPPQAALSIDNFDTQGNYIDPGSDQREAEPLMILHKKTTYLSTQAARSPSTRQRTRRVLKTTKFVADGVFI